MRHGRQEWIDRGPVYGTVPERLREALLYSFGQGIPRNPRLNLRHIPEASFSFQAITHTCSASRLHTLPRVYRTHNLVCLLNGKGKPEDNSADSICANERLLGAAFFAAERLGRSLVRP